MAANERQVLMDCHSEQVAALVDGHNKMVALLHELAAGRPDLLKEIPRVITIRRKS